MKESPSESCLIAGAATKASPAEIESRLARHPSTSLGGRVDGLEQSCGSSLSGVSSEDRKLLAAEFHLDMNRLKQAEVSSHESIAAIDSVLGRKPLQDIPCADSRLPEIDRSCRALQACPASGGLKEQAEEIRQAWPLLVELERRISAGEEARKDQFKGASYGGRLDSRALSEADASVESARRLLSQLKATYPAIDGKEFRKALNPKQGNFEEALTRQLESTRSKLVEESAKYRGAMECLNSPLTCGKCGDYDEVLARAPAFDSTRFSGPGRASKAERQEDLAVQSYLAAIDCRQQIRGARAEAGKAVTDFAVGAGLTVATAGLGTIAAGARAVGAAVEATAATTTAGRVAAVLTKPLVTVNVSSRSAAVARFAILGSDLAFAGEGVHHAMKECDQLLNQLSSSESAGTGGAQCPGAAQSKQVQLLADYRACALSATLNIAPNLLPFAPAFVKSFRSRSVRAPGKSPGLAPTQRLPEERLLSLSPEARSELIRNMQLDDSARAAKLSDALGLPPNDPKVRRLMDLHADARYSDTLEASTTELQKKIDAAMEITVPGYGSMPAGARRAYAKQRIEMADLVRKGVLGRTSSEVQKMSGKVWMAERRVDRELGETYYPSERAGERYPVYEKISPKSLQDRHNRIFRTTLGAGADGTIRRVRDLRQYFNDMKGAIENLRELRSNATDEVVEKVATARIREIQAQVRQAEREIEQLADLRQGYGSFSHFPEFDPSKESRELKELLQELTRD